MVDYMPIDPAEGLLELFCERVLARTMATMRVPGNDKHESVVIRLAEAMALANMADAPFDFMADFEAYIRECSPEQRRAVWNMAGAIIWGATCTS